MAAAAPIPRNRYKVNGVFSSILPPDENTNEMAVDCPASYVATHPPMSGRSTPKGAIDAPPPTPLDGSVVSAQNPNTTTNLKVSCTDQLLNRYYQVCSIFGTVV